MTQRSTARPVERGDGVVAIVQAYLTWLEERDAVRDCYERWAGGSSWGPTLAFGAFQDALDREERASQVYEMVIRDDARSAPAAAPVARLFPTTEKSPAHDEADARPEAA